LNSYPGFGQKSGVVRTESTQPQRCWLIVRLGRAMIHPMAATGESSARIASVYGSKLRFKLQLVSISLSKELALLVLVRGSWYFESVKGERGLVCSVPQRTPLPPSCVLSARGSDGWSVGWIWDFVIAMTTWVTRIRLRWEERSQILVFFPAEIQ